MPRDTVEGRADRQTSIGLQRSSIRTNDKGLGVSARMIVKMLCPKSRQKCSHLSAIFGIGGTEGGTDLGLNDVKQKNNQPTDAVGRKRGESRDHFRH